MSFTSSWSKRVPSKKESTALKSAPLSSTEICNCPHGQAKHLLKKALLWGHKKYVWRSKGEPFKPKNTGSNMLWACFAASGIGTLYKICGIIKKEDYLQILQFRPHISSWMVETWTQLCLPTGQCRLTLSFWNGLPKAPTSVLLEMSGLCLKAGSVWGKKPI